MDPRVKDTTLINRADVQQVYGVQDAHSTYTGQFTEYDGIAADYDLRRDGSHDAQIAERIIEHFGGRYPRTLDIGCGSGALLSQGVVRPSDYSGVDPSQGMLNELVLRHPDVDRVFPGTLDDFVKTGSAEGYDLVVMQGVPGIDVGTLRVNPGGLLLVVDDAEGLRL
jgi:SAM-dependent methyltransferase